MPRLSVLVAALLLTSTACASKLGSRSLPDVRGSYNEAVSASTDEQMLLNVVRLRYLHSTTFLQVGSVTTQYALTTNVGVNGSGNIDRPTSGFVPGGNAGGSAGLVMTERPTITYLPLQGEAFVRRLATPLSPDQILLMIDSGWGADLVINTCVRQINDAYAPSSAEPSDEGNLHEVARLMHLLQDRHELVVVRDERGLELSVKARRDNTYSPEATALLRHLDLPTVQGGFRVTGMTHERDREQVMIRSRSVLSAMFYLAQGVDVPEGDAGAFEVTPGDGHAPRLHVRNSKQEPKNAYVKVRYRDRWFYVAEEDGASKRVFAFLNFMFNLTSAPSGGGPVLTVGA